MDNEIYIISIPFELKPAKKIYSINDTITLSLNLDEYYASNLDQSFPIRENLLLDFALTFYDTSGYKRSPEKNAIIDSFDFVLDSNASKFYSSLGSSSILLMANADREVHSISSSIKLIPKAKGLFCLHIQRFILSEDQFYADIKDGCGNEKYSTEISINQYMQDGQNKKLIENDSSLINKFGGWHQKKPVDEVLSKNNIYYFAIE